MSDHNIKTISGYHAHVYYDQETREQAAALREELSKHFTVSLGRWRDQPVGPHSRAMYQVAFSPELFGDILPYLMLHRGGLVILVHPETGDDLRDHRDYALWLGEKLALDLSVL